MINIRYCSSACKGSVSYAFFACVFGCIVTDPRGSEPTVRKNTHEPTPITAGYYSFTVLVF